MVNLIASPNRVLQLGYEGEDNVTQIIFNYDESWLSYGDGEFKVRVLRPGDKEAYNATDVVDNRSLMTLVMTVTSIELSKRARVNFSSFIFVMTLLRSLRYIHLSCDELLILRLLTRQKVVL